MHSWIFKIAPTIRGRRLAAVVGATALVLSLIPLYALLAAPVQQLDPLNISPRIIANTGIVIDEGASAIISPAELAASDPDNSPAQLIYTIVELPTSGTLSLTRFSQADLGSGLLTYTHDGGESLTDSFTFLIDDSSGGKTRGVFTITIRPTNDPPTLVTNSGATVDEGGTFTITPAELVSTDPDTDVTFLTYQVTTPPTGGTLSADSFTQDDINNGLVTYTHNGGEAATDSFEFIVDDQVTGTFNITINPINDLHTLAVNAGMTVDESSATPITADMLRTDDPDTPPDQLVYTVTTPPVNGSLSATTFTQADIDNGLVIYRQDGSETTSDSFVFTVDDGSNNPIEDTFNVTIKLIPDAPELTTNTGLRVDEGSAAAITSLELQTTVGDNPAAQFTYTVTTLPEHGTLSATTFTQSDIDNGFVTYTHDASETESDTFAFTVTDTTSGKVSESEFTISVNPINDLPELVANSGLLLDEGASALITAEQLQIADVDNTPDQITYTLTVPPANGSLSLTTFTQADIDEGLLSYTHNGSETNTDGFSFLANDGAGGTIEGTFVIVTNPVNDIPAITTAGLTLDEGSAAIIASVELSARDDDNSADQIAYTVTRAPGNGALSMSEFTQADIDSGLVTYTHNGGETTSDSFTFNVTDGISDAISGVFTIAITPVNDEPVIVTNVSPTVGANETITISSAQLRAADADNTPNQLFYVVTTAPAQGTLSLTTFSQVDIDNGRVTYTDHGSQGQTDSFTFTLSDTVGGAVEGVFVINTVNDPPVLAVNAGLALDEGTTAAISAVQLETTDVDNSADELTYTVVTAPAAGTLSLITFTQADINDGLVTYTHDGSETTLDGFTFTVEDEDGSSLEGAFTIIVNPVNDTPTLAENAGLTIDEGATAALTAADFPIGDADNSPEQITVTITAPPVNGTLSMTTFTQADIENNAVTYSHNGSETTADSFAFTVSDSSGATSSSTFLINVTPMNDAPVVTLNFGLTINEGAAAILSAEILAASDADNTADELTYTVTTLPAHGTLSLDTFTQAELAEGLVTYSHDGSEETADSFAFTVEDSGGATVDGMFDVTVNPVNDAPVITVSSLTLDEGETINLSSSELQATDPDNTAGELTYTVTSPPASGRLSVVSFTQADVDEGLIAYTHDGSETTSDSFVLAVIDSRGASSSGTVSVTINPINDAPSATTNAGLMLDEGSAATLSAAQLQATDPDNRPDQITFTITGKPSHGTLSADTFTQADIDAGLITYIHSGDEATGDTFEFSLSDGEGGSGGGTFAITINPVNDIPAVVVNTGLTIDEGASAVITRDNLRADDPDNSADQLRYSIANLPSNGTLSLTTFTQADIDNGLLTYSHNGSETTSDSVEFLVEDAGGAATGGIFTITVNSVNDTPEVIVNTGLALDEGASAIITANQLQAIDSDGSPDQLTYTVTTPPTNGTLSVNTFTQADLFSGVVTYTHDGSELTSDTFAFSVSDEAGGAADGTFTIAVTPINDPPVITVNAGITVDEGASAVISNTILATTDADNAPDEIVYTVTAPGANGALADGIVSFTQQDIDDGLIAYVHNGSETTSDSFIVSVVDGADGSPSSAIINVTVNPINDAPTLIGAATITIDEGAAAILSSEQIQSVDPDSSSANLTLSISQPPAHGSLSLTEFTPADIAAGLLVYTNNGDEATSDSFSITADDGDGGISTSDFIISVNPVNDNPAITTNQGLLVAEGGAAVISADQLAATDPDNTTDELTYTVITPPTNGTLSIDTFTQTDIDEGLLTYTHNGGETISDTFAIIVDDGSGGSTSATVTIAVTSVNDLPSLVVNGALALDEGSAATITTDLLQATDADNSPAQLTYTITTFPAHGDLSHPVFTQEDIDRGLVTFTHDGSETTDDHFEFTVEDGAGGTINGAVAIAVAPVNDTPTVTTNIPITLEEGGSTTITGAELSATDDDNSTDQLVYTVVTPPAHGSLSLTTFTQRDIDSNLLRYVHNGDEPDTDTFQFTVDDGSGSLATDIFTFTITPVNDAPAIAINAGLMLTDGETALITNAELLTTDVDNPPDGLTYTVTGGPSSGKLSLMVFTQADIDDGLLTYTHDGSAAILDGFNFTVDDGSGRAARGTFTITIAIVNDAPTLSANTGLAVEPGRAAVITDKQLKTIDLDNRADQLTYTITSAPINGTLSLNIFTQADIDSGLLTYSHNGSETTSDSFGFTVDDGRGGMINGTFVITIAENARG